MAASPTPVALPPLNAPVGPWTARGFPNWPTMLGDRAKFNNSGFASSCRISYNSTVSLNPPTGISAVGLCNLPVTQIHQSSTSPSSFNLTWYANGEDSPTPGDCVAIFVVPSIGPSHNAKCDVQVFDAIYDHYVNPPLESSVGGLPLGGGSWNINQSAFPGINNVNAVPPEKALLDPRNPGYVLIPRGALDAQMQATLREVIGEQQPKNPHVPPPSNPPSHPPEPPQSPGEPLHNDPPILPRGRLQPNPGLVPKPEPRPAPAMPPTPAAGPVNLKPAQPYAPEPLPGDGPRQPLPGGGYLN